MDITTLESTIIGIILILVSISTLQKIKIKLNKYNSNVNRLKKSIDEVNSYDFNFDSVNEKSNKDLAELREKSHQSALNDEDQLVVKN